MKSINPSEFKQEGNKITIYAPEKTDYFRCPSTGNIFENAPFYYEEVTGDFVMSAKVTPNFEDTYDACVFMVVDDMKNYFKLCFEGTDFGTRAVVSVVTKDVSDDSNGINVEGDSVYLQVARKGNAFGLHYSLDGKNYIMHRLFKFDMPETVKVGLEAQAPVGKGGNRLFEDFGIQAKTLEHLRDGK